MSVSSCSLVDELQGRPPRPIEDESQDEAGEEEDSGSQAPHGTSSTLLSGVVLIVLPSPFVSSSSHSKSAKFIPLLSYHQRKTIDIFNFYFSLAVLSMGSNLLVVTCTSHCVGIKESFVTALAGSIKY